MRGLALTVGLLSASVLAGCGAPPPKPSAGLVGSWVGRPGPGQVSFDFTDDGAVTITSTGQGGGKTITTTEVKGTWKALGATDGRTTSIEIVYTGGRFVAGNEKARKPFEDTMAQKAGSTLSLLVEWVSDNEVKLSPQRATTKDGKAIETGQEPLTLTRLGSHPDRSS